MAIAITCITSETAASQTKSGQPTIGAGAVLTRDLVAPLTENKKILDLIPPKEEALGASGTACHYGSVRLQLFVGRGRFAKIAFNMKGVKKINGLGNPHEVRTARSISDSRWRA